MKNKAKITKNIIKKQTITTDRNEENTEENTEESGEESSNEHSETNQVQEKYEIGGRKGLEPTRFGDWEKNGRCIDF